MGKWSHLRGEVATLPSDTGSAGPSLKVLLTAACEESAALDFSLRGLHSGISGATDATVEESVSALTTLRDLRSTADGVTKALNKAIEAVQRRLVDTLEESGIESVKAAGYSVTRTDEPYPVVADRALLAEHAARGKMLDVAERDILDYMAGEGVDAVSWGGLTVRKGVPADTDAPALPVDELAMRSSCVDLAPQWQSLKREVKRRIEDGEELPPGVDVYLKEGLSIRKVK